MGISVCLLICCLLFGNLSTLCFAGCLFVFDCSLLLVCDVVFV